MIWQESVIYVRLKEYFRTMNRLEINHFKNNVEKPK
jgi:hypothetical protein